MIVGPLAFCMCFYLFPRDVAEISGKGVEPEVLANLARSSCPFVWRGAGLCKQAELEWGSGAGLSKQLGLSEARAGKKKKTIN